MSILIDEKTKVLVQGFTGDTATFHAREMIAYGTNVVGGVTPGKGGSTHLDRPVFNTVKEAVRETGATASIIFVPAAFCADSIMEAADAGIRFIVTITDGIPAQDMMMVKRYLFRFPKERRTTLVGPNCAGVISPGKAMLGIMPGHIHRKGPVGVVSGSLTLPRQSRMMASLDHCMWFHHPARADEWLLYELEAVAGAHARGVARGSLWTLDGRLVVSLVQEVLARPRRS